MSNVALQLEESSPEQSAQTTAPVLLAQDGDLRLHTDVEHTRLYLSLSVAGRSGEQLVGCVRALLDTAQIRVSGPPLADLEAKLGSLRETPTDLEHELLVATQEAVHGHDAPVTWHVQIHPPKVDEDSTEAIDLREVQHWCNVSADDTLFELGASLQGADGLNLHGEVIPARQGRDLPIEASTGCTFKGQTCVATSAGSVRLVNGKVSVDPILKVDGDLSYKVGNVDFEGAVRISGSVPNGFSVKASGDVTVAGSVKGATISAGGKVEVKSGITDGAEVEADGDVIATYIHQSKVRAGGDVRVRKEIIRSVVRSGGNLLASGASVIGESVSARGRLEVGTASSREEIPTLLIAGVSPDVADLLLAAMIEQAKVDEEIAEIESKGGEKIEREYLATLKGPVRAHYRGLAKKRDKLRQSKEALQQGFFDALALAEACEEAGLDKSIVVNRQSYARVTLQIARSDSRLLTDPISVRKRYVREDKTNQVRAEA